LKHSQGRKTAKEEVKRIEIRKEVVKVSVFADDVIVFISNPQNPTSKLL
jgi:histidinol-phosphate/aromatic aminotransferase/cobyric acid decarboxylase-like protein